MFVGVMEAASGTRLDWPLGLGDTVGIVGAAAAIVAAVFALRADWFGRRQALRADTQRDREIKPRLRTDWREPSNRGRGLEFYNIGGPAPNLVWIGLHGGRLYVAWASLDGHFTQPIHIEEEDLGEIPTGLAVRDQPTGTLIFVAEDVDNRWWNVLTDKLVEGDTKTYLLDQLRRLELGDF